MRNDLMLTLWNQCNNRCKFCYNINHYNVPNNIDEHLQTCISILQSNFIESFNTIHLVGGEIFDKSCINNHFFEILNILIDLLDNNRISHVHFITNLIYKDTTLLYDVLNKFKNKNISLGTSYDVDGRFIKNNEQLWWNNLKKLQTDFPTIPLDVGIIITQQFIDFVTKEWLDNFKNKVNCDINFNELYTGIDGAPKTQSSFCDMFPRRKDFLVFLKNLKQWGYNNYFDIGEKTNLIHYIFDSKLNCPIMKNVKIEAYDNYTGGYIDSNSIMTNDIKRILEEI